MNIAHVADPPLFAGPGFVKRINGSSVIGGSISDWLNNGLIIPSARNAINKNCKRVS